MKKLGFICTLLLLFTVSAKQKDDVPQTVISNGLITAKLYLPDSEDGYYRGTRFDWSGVISSLDFNQHAYFGKWFEKYSPTLHDAIMGPVEDFYPVGYDEAAVGENFLKIGIGLLAKPAEKAYFFVNPYTIVDPGKWKVKRKNDQVSFIHQLESEKFGYEYQKTVRLVKGEPRMIISHSFKNNGNQLIETNVYDHNFFTIDNQQTGPQFTITFPFKPSGETTGNSKPGKIEGNQITFDREFAPTDHLFYPSLQGFSQSATDYDIKVENHNSGAGVRITANRPLSKLVFWSAVKTVCPEPYIHLKVNPGEVFTWNIAYEFYTFESKENNQ